MTTATQTKNMHRIVIVGGGAGGLELATRLGDKLGRRKRALVTLVDKSRTHLWKPLLHQVAAGSMDLNDHELDYLFQARWHYFQFQLGSMAGLDREKKEIHIEPTLDAQGREVIPARSISYDTLVIAVGSQTNDFGTPGAQENAIALETAEQAVLFHSRLLNACLRANAQTGPLQPGQLHIVIIGAGATGVELSAELHNTTREFVSFGLERIHPEEDIKNHVIVRTGHGLILLNMFPYAGGHLLVALGEARGRLLEYTPQQRAQLWGLTEVAADLMERTLRPQGINIGINEGRAAGAGVPQHLHVHLVPRWNGDVNFMSTVAQVRVIPSSLERMAERYRKMRR